jgi:diaminohydroxyphosphoribosylaminopyrimidine deaminase/5-amino-6-(5-phosphoribosylamino)uracil reductase
MKPALKTPEDCMRLALRLARRALGDTAPNPMVGAVLVKHGRVIGQGWHHRAGQPHAEIEALADARHRGNSPADATLYVTLEPCCTHGRTPPCTEAIKAAGIRHVVVGATDPNPAHAGRGFAILQAADISCQTGVLADPCTELNEAFNHWITHRTPWVVVKAALTLDGKIATASGESKWITSPASRAHAMRLRQASDAVLVGINTVLADDPGLTVRLARRAPGARWRVILDSQARTPTTSQVVTDAWAEKTIIVASAGASATRMAALQKRVTVWKAPINRQGLDLEWVLGELGRHNILQLLVEGGGEVNGSFLEQGLAHRVAFFYGPKILGGKTARKGVAGLGAHDWPSVIKLAAPRWRRLGDDLLLTARVVPRETGAPTAR